MSRLKLQQFWIILMAALLSVPCILSGQAYFGTVSGVVTDPAGAVVPKAKVILTDQEKGFTFTAVTNNERAIPVQRRAAQRLQANVGSSRI